jgi:NADPH:quinone reductase-like Zn-dependent oxidoreductase
MKAIVYHNYGSPDVLKYEEIEKPTARDDEVLIKVRAASVNPVDRLFRGSPYMIRILTGLRKPKNTRVGVDVAGHVEAVGRNVTQFKPGDEVFGACRGAFAEYACASESAIVIKPDNATFEQAASVPVAAMTALQGLRDKGRIQSGQKVLINGAAGGVGTFALQIAKSFGAEVTGVCSARNLEMIRSIGADCVIDYTRENFTKGAQRYDLIFDCVGNHPLSAIRRVLNPNGRCILVRGPSKVWGILTRALKELVLSRFVSQNFVMFIAKRSKEDLTIMRELIEAENVTPVIDRRYSLSETPDAIRYLEEGRAQGKVVITLGT